jgi:hypothetical protein
MKEWMTALQKNPKVADGMLINATGPLQLVKVMQLVMLVQVKNQ